MDTLKLRHATTLSTSNAEVVQLQDALERERGESERIRAALDELTEDIARESFGRRREVSVRLAFLSREENLAESLRRWVRKAKESLERTTDGQEAASYHAHVRGTFSKAVADAELLLDTLNGQPSTVDGVDVGSMARLILAQDMVASLTQQLQEETIRRLTTERKFAKLPTVEHYDGEGRAGEPSRLAHPVPHRISENTDSKRLLDVDGPSPAGEVSPSPSEEPTID